jgi:hypothetical protein
MIEAIGKKTGRARMKLINSAVAEKLLPFIQENFDIGSKIITDCWSGYSKVSSLGYEYNEKNMISDKEALSHVHLIILLLKRWLLGLSRWY